MPSGTDGSGSSSADNDGTLRRPESLIEAFANTAKSLQQFGIERIRVVGLSVGCSFKEDLGDSVRTVTEQEFMREYVFHSRPCIILNAIDDWPALEKWRNDQYLFDLDHHLPSEEEASTDEEEDDEEEDDAAESEEKEKEIRAACEKQKREEAELDTGAEKLPKLRGPKKVTVALTPNGRADAVTYALYDTADVPEDMRESVFTGKEAVKDAVLLKNHPLLTPGDVTASAAATVCSLRMEKLFMYAAELKVTLPELYTLLAKSPVSSPPHTTHIDMRMLKESTATIAYAQLQNNCLNTEYKHLHADLRTNVEDFGKRVFGENTEAANVWFGVPASVSSMHQDWVENLYPVVRGVKEFLLIPPWEGVFVPKPEIPSAGFVVDESRSDHDSLSFEFAPYPAKDGTLVPWMDFDVTGAMLDAPGGEQAVLDTLNASISDNESRKPHIGLGASGGPLTAEEVGAEIKKKQLKALHPLVAYVKPGETLYLPAMWLHRVAQHADEVDIRARAFAKSKGQTPPLPLIAAVNYWYDMSFVNPSVVMLREFGLLL